MANAKEPQEKKTQENKSVFEKLAALDVSAKVETKEAGTDKWGNPIKLSYLSWAWAWAEVKKHCPDANYEIIKNEAGLPYFSDFQTGYIVYTRVTIEGITHEMWLPVMDGNNRAMKADPYRLTFKSGNSITVPAATMTDINKTIMRCLTKNLAMFGLGLNIYAGEDLPMITEEKVSPVFTCANCGGTFDDEKVAAATMKRYKKHICMNCIEAKKKELLAKKKAEEEAKKKAEEEAKAAETARAEEANREDLKASVEASASNDLPFEF